MINKQFKLINSVIKLFKVNKQYLIAMILVIFASGPIVMFETFMQSWIKTFKDENGPVNSDDKCLFLFEYQAAAGCVASFLLAVGFGRYADKISPKVSIPICFSIRGLVFTCYYFVEPGTNLFYVISPCAHVAYYGTLIVIFAYMECMYTIDIRGILSSITGILGQIGSLLFTIICNYMFQHQGNSSPLAAIAGLDFLMAVLTLVFAFLGLI